MLYRNLGIFAYIYITKLVYLPTWHGCFLVEVSCPQTGLHRILDPFKIWNLQIHGKQIQALLLCQASQGFWTASFSRFCWPARACLAQEEGVLANLLGRLVVTDELETLFFDWHNVIIQPSYIGIVNTPL